MLVIHLRNEDGHQGVQNEAATVKTVRLRVLFHKKGVHLLVECSLLLDALDRDQEGFFG